MRMPMFAVLLSFLACTNSNEAKPPPAKPEMPRAAPSASSPPPAAPVPTGGLHLTSFPAVDTSPLDATGRTFFEKIANDEICPCDCPKSFGACLQEGSACRPAVLLGNWIVRKLNEGLPGEALAEPITREITGGFMSAPKTPDVNGYASKGGAQPLYTIVEYADFECGHCKAAAPILEELVKKQPDKVRVVFKHFPLSFHAMARKAAIAAEAAGRQNKFWQMHDAIFATQEIISDELIIGHAKAIGLDVTRFQKDLNDPAIAAKVEASRKEGEAFGIEATPAIYVNGRPYHLTRTLDGFDLRFRMEDARASSSCQ